MFMAKGVHADDTLIAVRRRCPLAIEESAHFGLSSLSAPQHLIMNVSAAPQVCSGARNKED
jgi:hypothetical protein